jgi:NO-binding membrane sensor protein with MHYT domain
MFNRVKALFSIPDVLKQGKMVANPESWKKGQVTGGVVAGLLGSLIAISKVFGYELPLSDDQLLSIGSGVVAICGLFYTPIVTVATTEKIGISDKPSDGS